MSAPSGAQRESNRGQETEVYSVHLTLFKYQRCSKFVFRAPTFLDSRMFFFFFLKHVTLKIRLHPVTTGGLYRFNGLITVEENTFFILSRPPGHNMNVEIDVISPLFPLSAVDTFGVHRRRRMRVFVSYAGLTIKVQLYIG